MSTGQRHRAHRKRLGGGDGGGGGACWAVGMGGPFPCVSLCSGQPRPLREILTAATAPYKAVGLGARQWVYRKVTATVAPASCTGRQCVTQNTSAAPYPCAGSSPLAMAKAGTLRTRLCPVQRAPFDSKEIQSSQLTVADDRVRLLADTRFTRKLTAVHTRASRLGLRDPRRDARARLGPLRPADPAGPARAAMHHGESAAKQDR